MAAKMDDEDQKPFQVKLICDGSSDFKEASKEQVQKWMWLPEGDATFYVRGISPRSFAHFTAYLSTLVATKKLETAALVLHADELSLAEVKLLYHFALVVRMEPLAKLLADHINRLTPDQSVAELSSWMDKVDHSAVTITSFV